MRVLLLTRYGCLGASTRVRSFQYLPYLESKGWEIIVSPLFSDSYIQALYSGQPRWVEVISGYWCRLRALVCAKKYDLIWIEKEVFPFMPALAERLLTIVGVPYVVDYDDALFHRYDKHSNWLIRSFLGRKIDRVMKYAALVVAGNEYLAERARVAGASRVEIVPTVVDLTRYKLDQSSGNHPLIVGWIGSPSTSHYLLLISSVYQSLAKEFDVRFVAIGANEEDVKGLPIEVWDWSEETEVQLINALDIGIMPLMDSPWERGKCGYKLIQYMACGIPVVASPVGVNKQIVKHGSNGYLADKSSEWEQSIRLLLNDSDLRKRMGVEGRELVEECYSLQVQAPRLFELMQDLIR